MRSSGLIMLEIKVYMMYKGVAYCDQEFYTTRLQLQFKQATHQHLKFNLFESYRTDLIFFIESTAPSFAMSESFTCSLKIV